MICKFDSKYHFKSFFDPETGRYMRTGILDENGRDTDKDPFMTSFPELIDIGIMGHCAHGLSGKCRESGIECYQHGDISRAPHMTLENYKAIIDECRGKTFQVALGGCGDPDMHPDFEELLRYTKERKIVPNFTTSGFGMTKEKAGICKKYCGAVAVSMYSKLDTGDSRKKLLNGGSDLKIRFSFGGIFEQGESDDDYISLNELQSPNYTMKAIKLLLDAGVKTNIHYVLSDATIDEALIRLRYGGFPSGINAVIFLLHKPVGLGSERQLLRLGDERIREFFKLIDERDFAFKIGFDSCTVPAIITTMKNFDEASLDSCEAARWSMYITPDMKALPCSFDNQAQRYAVDLKAGGIKGAWESEEFEKIRTLFKNRCVGCEKHSLCLGGCPLMKSVILCDERELYSVK